MAGTIEGLERLELNLDRIDGAVSGTGLKRALAAAAGVFEVGAKNRAAVKTGFMRNAIQAQTPVLNVRGGEVDIVAGADYSIHEEFGTSKRKKPLQPFMRPTIIEDKPQIQGAFSNVMSNEINNAIR